MVCFLAAAACCCSATTPPVLPPTIEVYCAFSWRLGWRESPWAHVIVQGSLSIYFKAADQPLYLSPQITQRLVEKRWRGFVFLRIPLSTRRLSLIGATLINQSELGETTSCCCDPQDTAHMSYDNVFGPIKLEYVSLKLSGETQWNAKQKKKIKRALQIKSLHQLNLRK